MNSWSNSRPGPLKPSFVAKANPKTPVYHQIASLSSHHVQSIKQTSRSRPNQSCHRCKPVRKARRPFRWLRWRSVTKLGTHPDASPVSRKPQYQWARLSLPRALPNPMRLQSVITQTLLKTLLLSTEYFPALNPSQTGLKNAGGSGPPLWTQERPGPMVTFLRSHLRANKSSAEWFLEVKGFLETRLMMRCGAATFTPIKSHK